MKPEFDAEDLIRLGKYNAAVYMRLHGQTQPAFSLTSDKPINKTESRAVAQAIQREKRIRLLSINQYTRRRREGANEVGLEGVLDWLRTRYPKRRRPTEMRSRSDEPEWFDKKD